MISSADLPKIKSVVVALNRATFNNVSMQDMVTVVEARQWLADIYKKVEDQAGVMAIAGAKHEPLNNSKSTPRSRKKKR